METFLPIVIAFIFILAILGVVAGVMMRQTLCRRLSELNRHLIEW